MNILKQAFAVSLLALIVALVVNLIRSDGIPLFPSHSNDLVNKDQIKQISLEEAQNLLEKKEALFVDLRPSDSFNLTRIPGSLNFPYKTIYGMLASFSQQIPINARIILYGINKEDTSPWEVASLLQLMGYSNIYIMIDGWSGWEHMRQKNL